MDAEFFALADDRIDILEAQIELVAVIGSPASGAVQIAGAGGVEQDGPGNVAAVFAACLLLLRPCEQVRFHQEGFQQRGHDLFVEMQRLHDELVPVILLLERSTKRLALLGKQRFGHQRLEHVHNRVDMSFGIFDDIVDELVQSCTLHVLACIHDDRPFRADLCGFVFSMLFFLHMGIIFLWTSTTIANDAGRAHYAASWRGTRGNESWNVNVRRSRRKPTDAF